MLCRNKKYKNVLIDSIASFLSRTLAGNIFAAWMHHFTTGTNLWFTTICLMMVQINNGFPKYQLWPKFELLTVALLPWSWDCNSVTWQPALIYNWLYLLWQNLPLVKLDLHLWPCDLTYDCSRNGHKIGSSHVMTQPIIAMAYN